MLQTPAAAAARAGGGDDIIDEVGSDDEPEEVGDGALDPGDEAAAAEPGDDVLAPHGVQWTVQADQGLGGNDRSESEYFMHFYPTGHIAEMVQATNANLDAHGGDRHLTQQEYFWHGAAARTYTGRSSNEQQGRSRCGGRVPLGTRRPPKRKR